MLLVYNDTENRKLLTEKYNSFHFVGAAYFIPESDNINDIISYLDEQNYEHYVMDVSNWIRNDNNAIYLERFFWVLTEYINDIHFCIQAMLLPKFLNLFPDLFKEDEIIIEYNKSEIENDESNEKAKKKYCIPDTIYVYENIKGIIDKNRIMSFGELLEKYEGVVIQYNIEEIKNRLLGDTEYIDISSMIQTLSLRNDFLLTFEVLILKISSFYAGKFCIHKDLLKQLDEKFPFYFREHVDIDTETTETELKDNVIPNVK